MKAFAVDNSAEAGVSIPVIGDAEIALISPAPSQFGTFGPLGHQSRLSNVEPPPPHPQLRRQTGEAAYV